ncbi:MAG: glycosyltransferase family 4 protein [Actinomycetota bacterium]|nr:glycosyltransferase family 4 protein [Actinomycetota bacterium]
MTSRSLSFCMATTFYPPYNFGGDGMHVYRLSTELARRGHRVTVVYSVSAYTALAEMHPTEAYEMVPGITLRPIAGLPGPLRPLATYLSGRPALNARALAEVFRERFDVIHFHNVSLLGGPGILSYGDAIKLYTTNEHWLVCPMHVLWKNNREPCYEPHCLRCTLAFRRPPQLWRYTNLLERQLANVDVFLSPSRFTIRAHHERGFSRPIKHLPYFLPVSDTLASQLSPETSSRPYFLFVGRLEKLKGVQTLIERFRHYREADLLIAGEGGYARELRRLARGVDNIRFLGRVHPKALPPLYANAIALLVPSIGFEVFGIVILEAFAQKTPAIVRDLGALPEVVSESGGGYVYRTEEELTEAMEGLRLDRELRDRLGSRGHETWLARWSEQPHFEEYFSAIEEARALAP